MTAAGLQAAAEAARPRLVALAYRMLGSLSDAEDVVQDALVKAHRAAPAHVEFPEAYLTTITTRTALDHLRSARVRRESYVGPWLPEPLIEDPAPDLSAQAAISDSISMAFLVVLESLSPAERAVLLLHDVFGYRHAEVGAMLDRSEGASRQLLRSARQRVAAGRPRYPVAPEEHELLVRRFVAACEGGSMEDFLAVLDERAVFVSDGGATVKAARRPITGAVRIARFLAKTLPRGAKPVERHIVVVNGQPAIAILNAGTLTSLAFVEGTSDGVITELRFLRNPDKLAGVRVLLRSPSPADIG